MPKRNTELGLQKAQDAIDFISDLKHTKGIWHGVPFDLLDWEKEILVDIFGTVHANGLRQYRTGYIEIPKKNGKALALDTPIPTPDGWVNMEDLKPGDRVFDESGKSCNVAAVTETMMGHPCYEVLFSDGGRIVADAAHEWKTLSYKTYRKQGKRIKNSDYIHTTEEIRNALNADRQYDGAQGLICRNHRIDVSEYKQIVAVNPVESVPVKCIQVDSPSRLYLAGKTLTPTHNSELAAGIALYLLCGDGEWAAEVYGCASDRGQASLVFDVAVDMVDQHPKLRQRIRPVLSVKRLIYLPTNSYYQVCSSEAYTKHGFNISGCIFDELHAQPNRDLWDVMTQGAGDARLQPLTVAFTTAGLDPDRSSIGWEVHQKSVDVLHRVKRIPTWYAKIYGTKESDDWTDEKVWRKANPSIGHNLRIETIRAAFREAKQSPVEELKFRQLRLNQWVKTKKAKWISQDIWDQNIGLVVPEKLAGKRCFGGLDLSSKRDITAFTLIFPPDKDPDKVPDGQIVLDKYTVLSTMWIPEDNIEARVRQDHVAYDEWAKHGWIHTTAGNVIDYTWIEKAVLEMRDKYDIVEIGYDPWNAQQTATNLTGAGLQMVEVRQGYKSLSPPTRELEAWLYGGKMNVGMNPVLRWMFGNVQVMQDVNDNIRPVKGKAAERIDGIMALVIATNRLIADVQLQQESIYETTGNINL